MDTSLLKQRLGREILTVWCCESQRYEAVGLQHNQFSSNTCYFLIQWRIQVLYTLKQRPRVDPLFQLIQKRLYNSEAYDAVYFLSSKPSWVSANPTLQVSLAAGLGVYEFRKCNAQGRSLLLSKRSSHVAVEEDHANNQSTIKRRQGCDCWHAAELGVKRSTAHWRPGRSQLSSKERWDW